MRVLFRWSSMLLQHVGAEGIQWYVEVSEVTEVAHSPGDQVASSYAACVWEQILIYT